MSGRPELEHVGSGLRVGTADDVAALLRIHRNRVYQMVQRGELPTLRRIGGALRFDMDEIERWLRAGDDAAPPAGRAAP